MPPNLQEGPKLVIVSDTPVWQIRNGEFVGFEPVIREIENFEHIFGEITWIAYKQPGDIWGNARSTTTKINMVYLPQIGGKRLIDKLKILFRIPTYGWKVLSEIRRADVVHSRAPSLPAFFAIIYSFFDRGRVYWHKYAGTWTDKAPVFYAFQRWLLKSNINSTVTINGNWPGQDSHLLTFENPCLTKEEVREANATGRSKKFERPYVFCFAGNLNHAKGILPFVRVFKKFSEKYSEGTFKLHIAGDGELRNAVEAEVQDMEGVTCHGFLTRSDLKKIYEMAHFLVLPSKSEGFPKVVAEASAYGCLPMVSDVSAIRQYIHSGVNGFLFKGLNEADLYESLVSFFSEKEHFNAMAQRAMDMSMSFTYERYSQRIQEEILVNRF